MMFNSNQFQIPQSIDLGSKKQNDLAQVCTNLCQIIILNYVTRMILSIG